MQQRPPRHHRRLGAGYLFVFGVALGTIAGTILLVVPGRDELRRRR
jgi:hypothetical protein